MREGVGRMGGRDEGREGVKGCDIATAGSQQRIPPGHWSSTIGMPAKGYRHTREEVSNGNRLAPSLPARRPSPMPSIHRPKVPLHSAPSPAPQKTWQLQHGVTWQHTMQCTRPMATHQPNPVPLAQGKRRSHQRSTVNAHQRRQQPWRRVCHVVDGGGAHMGTVANRAAGLGVGDKDLKL